jgi:TetR/AcrR family transcriptional repressor of nem operon
MGRVKNEANHNKLLEAGLRAFLEQGFNGTGLKEVLDEVQVPKGSFYAYFASKEDFAVAVIRHYSACFGRKMDESIRDQTSPKQALIAFLMQLGREFEAQDFRGGCLLANLAGELENSEICRRALRDGFADWEGRIETLIHHGQEAGEFRRDLPPSHMAALLVDAWEGAVLRMKVTGSQEPLHRCISHTLEDHFLP